MLGSFITFLGVPAGVAAVRGQARWLLAPVVEVALAAIALGGSSWF